MVREEGLGSSFQCEMVLVSNKCLICLNWKDVARMGTIEEGTTEFIHIFVSAEFPITLLRSALKEFEFVFLRRYFCGPAVFLLRVLTWCSGKDPFSLNCAK